MRVRINKPRFLGALIAYLEECDCAVMRAGRTEVEVFMPEPHHEQAARMELGVYLTAWRMRHTGVTAQIID
jgi:hypothetical protein